MPAVADHRSADWVTSVARRKVKRLWGDKRLFRRRVTYELQAHYHPYVDDLIQTLNSNGLNAFLDPVYHASLTRPWPPPCTSRDRS